MGRGQLWFKVRLRSDCLYFGQGLVCFLLKSTEEAQCILQRNWCIDSSSLALKMWTPLFDANWERLNIAPICVHLPWLPLDYCSPWVLKDIGNSLEDFSEVDISFKTASEMTVTWILGWLDAREGLVEEMEIERGTVIIIQRLDYEGVPFICHHYYQYGHLSNQCHLPFRTKDGLKYPRDSNKGTLFMERVEKPTPSPKARGFEELSPPVVEIGEVSGSLAKAVIPHLQYQPSRKSLHLKTNTQSTLKESLEVLGQS